MLPCFPSPAELTDAAVSADEAGGAVAHARGSVTVATVPALALPLAAAAVPARGAL